MENSKYPIYPQKSAYKGDDGIWRDINYSGLSKLEYTSIEAMKGLLSTDTFAIDVNIGRIKLAEQSIECAKELLKHLENE